MTASNDDILKALHDGRNMDLINSMTAEDVTRATQAEDPTDSLIKDVRRFTFATLALNELDPLGFGFLITEVDGREVQVPVDKAVILLTLIHHVDVVHESDQVMGDLYQYMATDGARDGVSCVRRILEDIARIAVKG